jgi:hypothetical protein
MPCRNQCRSPFGIFGKPCDWCAAEYERLMDESYEDYKIEKLSVAFEKILPATDSERRAFLDQVAPVVAVRSSEPCPVCRGTEKLWAQYYRTPASSEPFICMTAKCPLCMDADMPVELIRINDHLVIESE